MINFGKYGILEGAMHTFEKEPELWWKFRTPTPRDEIDMVRWTDEHAVKVTEDGKDYRLPPMWVEIMTKELSLLFDSTNLTADDGSPALPNLAAPDRVEAFIRSQMPQELATELWSALGKCIPNWGARPPKPVTTPAPNPVEPIGSASLPI